MQTIDKQIDGKSVSFWLEGEFVRASIGDRIIGDVAAAIQVPGFVGPHWTRSRDWQEFARLVLAPMPGLFETRTAGVLWDDLFDIVWQIGNELRKEAA
jgi:hypothetical protein